MRQQSILFPAVKSGVKHSSAAQFLMLNHTRDRAFCISWLNMEFERQSHRMAGKNGNKGKAFSGRQDGWVGFANIDLDATDRQALSNGVLGIEDALEVCAEILVEGHKISLSHNSETGSITASATGVRDGCPNKGFTLSSFANDIPKAVIVLAYKHAIKSKRVWANAARATSSEDWG